MLLKPAWFFLFEIKSAWETSYGFKQNPTMGRLLYGVTVLWNRPVANYSLIPMLEIEYFSSGLAPLG